MARKRKRIEYATDETQIIEFMDREERQMEVIVQRTMEAQAEEGLDVSLSEEALDDLAGTFMAWVTTRMVRYETQTGLMPQSVKVSINVEVQG